MGSPPDDKDGNTLWVMVARMEVKIDQFLKSQEDHETRLRALERWKYALPVTAFTALTSVVLTMIGIYGK